MKYGTLSEENYVWYTEYYNTSLQKKKNCSCEWKQIFKV
jgi:hypothetical protein